MVLLRNSTNYRITHYVTDWETMGNNVRSSVPFPNRRTYAARPVGRRLRRHESGESNSDFHSSSSSSSSVYRGGRISGCSIDAIQLRKGAMEMRERKVRPDCVNATNPYHHCNENCSPNHRSHAHKSKLVPNGNHRSKEEGKKGEEGRKVDPRCVNASNPYHQCSDHCNKRMNHGSPKPDGVVKLGSAFRFAQGKEEPKMGEKRKVNSNCPNASNPFHECSEYCSKRIHGKGQATGGKPVITVNTHKEAVKMAERGDVHPKCANASNPYHKCSEHCFQKINRAI